VTICIAFVIILGCKTNDQISEGQFMVLLGQDTVGIEQYELNSNEIYIEALRRINSVSKSEAKIKYREDASISSMEELTYNKEGTLIDRNYIKSNQDSLFYENGINADITKRSVKARPHLFGAHIPFYATYEKLILNYKSNPNRSFEFIALYPEPLTIENKFENEFLLTAEIIKTIKVTTNSIGEVDEIKGSGNSLTYHAKRIDAQKYQSIFNKWMKDSPTKIIKTVSPRINETFEVDGATINIDYSSPSKRNRDIFGKVVLLDKVWRTGANLATHIEFNKDLIFLGQKVIAGKYTLYTIPRNDTWLLLLNKQIGQWGTYYDETQEILRIPMKKIELDDKIEKLRIEVEQTDGINEIIVKWDNIKSSVEFDVVK